MWRLIFVILCLCSAITGYAQTRKNGIPSEVALAEEARVLLSKTHHEAGFGIKEVCKLVPQKNKPAIQKCRPVEWFNVSLAIKRGNEPFKVIKVDGTSCVSQAEGFDTFCYVNHLGHTNGANTEFVITKPSGYKVFAIRRWVMQHGAKKEVVYTPYSDAINTADVRANGYLYLSRLIEDAKRELRAKNVRSAANPTALVADRIPTETVIRLAIIEHVDHFRFKKEGIAQPAGEALVIYALNRDLAYRYSKSTAGAQGLLQFIEDTYVRLVAKYPRAELIPTFREGVLNSLNMAKAAVLLLDDGMSQLPLELRQKVFASEKLFEEFSASGYNGGVKRPRTILLAGKDLVAANRNEENRIYVQKMRAIRAHPRLW